MRLENQHGWLTRLSDRLAGFLSTLQAPHQPGRFFPCPTGATTQGQNSSLGFSCFALKIYYTVGLWEELTVHQRAHWIRFLKSFQTNQPSAHEQVRRNAFTDLPVTTYLANQVSWRRKLLERVWHPKQLTHLQRTIIAETKQTIATLAQVGAQAELPYLGFPATPKSVKKYLLRLDWDKPWGAGGQAAALAVFLITQAPRFLDEMGTEALFRACRQVFDGLAAPQTGGYLTGQAAEYGELINGAMKVLTALDWLETPVHYPESLIDTCLQQYPSPEGCHVVDAVYVLHRCLLQTDYKRRQIQAYCMQVLEMIAHHHNLDGGFSYYIGQSQTHYYGVPITRGLAESDIHGTCLLTWALAMIREILQDNSAGWRVIRP